MNKTGVTILTGIAALATALGAGCATSSGSRGYVPTDLPAASGDSRQNTGYQPSDSKRITDPKWAAKFLGVDYDLLSYICAEEGKYTTQFEEGTLRTLAGIVAGTIKVRGGCDVQVGSQKCEYAAEGFYSQVGNPEALKKVCREADADGNNLITAEESHNYAMQMYDKYVKEQSRQPINPTKQAPKTNKSKSRRR